MNSSEAAYTAGIACLEGLAVSGRAPPASGLARARFREMAVRGSAADLAVRWETHAPGGGLFPALDADVTLSPDGAYATTLALAGVYRVPSGDLGGGLDGAIVRLMAEVTTRTFVGLMATAITAPHPGSGTGLRGKPGPRLLAARVPDALQVSRSRPEERLASPGYRTCDRGSR